jgi:hypothetical protein
MIDYTPRMIGHADNDFIALVWIYVYFIPATVPRATGCLRSGILVLPPDLPHRHNDAAFGAPRLGANLPIRLPWGRLNAIANQLRRCNRKPAHDGGTSGGTEHNYRNAHDQHRQVPGLYGLRFHAGSFLAPPDIQNQRFEVRKPINKPVMAATPITVHGLPCT